MAQHKSGPEAPVVVADTVDGAARLLKDSRKSKATSAPAVSPASEGHAGNTEAGNNSSSGNGSDTKGYPREVAGCHAACNIVSGGLPPSRLCARIREF